eukprot:5776930-Ditylum_brightwellii.AAC.1
MQVETESEGEPLEEDSITRNREQIGERESMNFNGITLHDSGAEFLDEFTTLKELGTSLVQGAEENNNWSQGDTYNRAKE